MSGSTMSGTTMSATRCALLADRGVVKISGPDARKLLQGVVTNDLDSLAAGGAIHAGLLSPQGKILFDFFVVDAGSDALLIDIVRDQVKPLIQRLTLYKLRAKADIADVSPERSVFALWGGPIPALPGRASVTAWLAADPRLPDLGARLILRPAGDRAPAELGAIPVAQADYDAHRVALGIPEAGKDFPLGDAFPHEALYDQLAGVSFRKGCFVGQEVVSRMQHRGTARKRIVKVHSATGDALPATGTPITAGAATIGTLGTTAGADGLALLRLDRVASALAKDLPLLAGETAVTVEIPAWAGFSMPPASSATDETA